MMHTTTRRRGKGADPFCHSDFDTERQTKRNDEGIWCPALSRKIGCPMSRGFARHGIPRTHPSGDFGKRHDREGHDFNRAASRGQQMEPSPAGTARRSTLHAWAALCPLGLAAQNPQALSSTLPNPCLVSPWSHSGGVPSCRTRPGQARQCAL